MREVRAMVKVSGKLAMHVMRGWLLVIFTMAFMAITVLLFV